MGVGLDSLRSNLLNQTTIENSSSALKLKSSLESDFSKASSEELMEVCKDFESYFTEQVFKSMSKMVPESEDEFSYASSLSNYFKDEYIKELADKSADGEGLGLAQQLYEAMKRNYGIEE